MIKVGDYEADRHSYHHAQLGTDLKVIQKQSLESSKDKHNPHTVVIHHHLAGTPCKGENFEYYHEVFPSIPRQRVGD